MPPEVLAHGHHFRRLQLDIGTACAAAQSWASKSKAELLDGLEFPFAMM
jgi:hypothetical protein